MLESDFVKFIKVLIQMRGLTSSQVDLFMKYQIIKWKSKVGRQEGASWD